MFHQQLARALTREKASRFDSSRVADKTFTSSERRVTHRLACWPVKLMRFSDALSEKKAVGARIHD
jgi:hypothetical protein